LSLNNTMELLHTP